jgi:soluble lytic murein transglycosylase-like protein
MKILLIILLTCKLLAMSEQQVLSIAERYSYSPSTVLAVAKTESSLKDNIVSHNGKDLGIMQIQVQTARFISSKDNSLKFIQRMSDKQLRYALIHNPHLNIIIGSKYLNWLYDRYGYKRGISRYNGDSTGMYYERVRSKL